jgi:hypothetical protein
VQSRDRQTRTWHLVTDKERDRDIAAIVADGGCSAEDSGVLHETALGTHEHHCVLERVPMAVVVKVETASILQVHRDGEGGYSSLGRDGSF